MNAMSASLLSPDAAVNAALNRGNPVVFFDVQIAGQPAGRMKMELFPTVAPRTVENFRQFCTGEHKEGGYPVGYKRSEFHRIVPNFIIQGGDFVKGDGTGSSCIYGTSTFEDEAFELRHSEAGVLSMANAGKDTNGCQFFITLAPQPSLDGKHVVFGKVLDDDSLRVVRKLEAVPLVGQKPSFKCIIAECGEL